MKPEDDIVEFGSDSFLSNSFDSPMEYGGLRYKNSEACYQAQKFKDESIKKKFRELSPDEARDLAAKTPGSRADWDSVKLDIMKEIVFAKFTQNESLANKLAQTGAAELAAAIGDDYWGFINGNGQNNLGKILMEVRTVLQENLIPENDVPEIRLKKLIMQRRYYNLCAFLIRQKTLYSKSGTVDSADINELKELMFKYNDLKEIHFIGPDLYSDATFIRHIVPFLYRSVGNDGDKKFNFHSAKDIFKECLEQIKSGNGGDLFSYSKCLGKVLFKYSTIHYGKLIIEYRKDVTVNSVLLNGKEYSLQKFERLYQETNSNNDKSDAQPHEDNSSLRFMVDMSNVRQNAVKNMKKWFDDYLGKQEYVKRFEDIFDPIGDAEVLSNFTNDDRSFTKEVKRMEFGKSDIKKFCALLYLYSVKLYSYIHSKEEQDARSIIENHVKTVKTISINQASIDQSLMDKIIIVFAGYEEIMQNTYSDLELFLKENVDWEKEKYYLSRVKAEKSTDDRQMQGIADLFKEETSEPISTLWKKLLKQKLMEG